MWLRIGRLVDERAVAAAGAVGGVFRGGRGRWDGSPVVQW